MKNPLDERVDRIRDLINSPRKHYSLRQDSTLFIMLCSCMDTIEDTERALESFLTEDTDSSGKGRNYLRMYGALQALFVQQDAVTNLHIALGIQCPEDTSIKEIRHIRNAAVGHPTDITIGKEKAFGFIHFGTLSAYEFQLMTINPRKAPDEEHNYVSKDVNVRELITIQQRIYMEVLSDLIEVLKKEEVDHRKKFVGKNLTDSFQTTTNQFAKIIEAIVFTNSPDATLIDNYIDSILNVVDEFKMDLRERGEPDDEISYLYEGIDNSLQCIRAYFNNNLENRLSPRSAYISASAAQYRIFELEAIAREIEERYSQ